MRWYVWDEQSYGHNIYCSTIINFVKDMRGSSSHHHHQQQQSHQLDEFSTSSFAHPIFRFVFSYCVLIISARLYYYTFIMIIILIIRNFLWICVTIWATFKLEAFIVECLLYRRNVIPTFYCSVWYLVSVWFLTHSINREKRESDAIISR